jgi:hypothetical protein
MAWSVRLQDENGKPVIEKDALIEFDLVPLNESHGLIRYIDPYGDMTFNGLQMPDFLAEWNLLSPRNEQEEREWKLVRDMGTRCESESHLYVKFIGD